MLRTACHVVSGGLRAAYLYAEREGRPTPGGEPPAEAVILRLAQPEVCLRRADQAAPEEQAAAEFRVELRARLLAAAGSGTSSATTLGSRVTSSESEVSDTACPSPTGHDGGFVRPTGKI